MEYVLTLFIMPMKILHKDEDYTIKNVLRLFIMPIKWITVYWYGMPMRKLYKDNKYKGYYTIENVSTLFIMPSNGVLFAIYNACETKQNDKNNLISRNK